MFRTRLVHGLSKEERSVAFFEDDSIQTVREQVSRSTDIHPDRLFILVGIRLSRNFYIRDARNWEGLFTRLSLNGYPIPAETFASYCKEYRSPVLAIQYREPIDKHTWMSYPIELKDIFEPVGDFVEYRILGVSPEKSYCLPWNVSSEMSFRIPSAQLPIPEPSRIVSSFYNIPKIQSLVYIPHEKDAPAYFPLLRATTPSRMTLDELQRLTDTSTKLESLLKLDPPVPSTTNVLRARWYITLVDTDFGDAIRSRFEQIFYGITLSKDTPCITYYTSEREASRHKFYTEDVKQKTPLLDTALWNAWWSVSKPSRRNRPTLVLYRGTSRENYDRVSISYSDITFSVYRDHDNTETVEDMQASIQKWFETFDAITPFVNPKDIADCRWDLQTVDFSAKYKTDVEELDIRRLQCVSFLFTILDIQKSAFRFLRADAVDEGLSPIEFRVLQLLRNDPGLTPDKIDFLSSHEAEYILRNITIRLEDDPDLLERSVSPFPVVRFTNDRVYVKAARTLDLPLRYINILRFILSDPKSKELDAVCPKRMESIAAERTFVPTAVIDETDEFADIFAQLEDVPETEEVVQPEEEQTKVRIQQKTGTMHRYFVNRLQEFDSDMFKAENVKEYSKHCDQGHQPSVLTNEELETILAEYDPRTYLEETEMMKTDKGVVMCPEFWCMYDRIPLRESQLVLKNGSLTCPVCGGKLQTVKADPKEYPVIQRLKGFVYPGMKSYTSSSGDTKNMPCCFKTPRTQKIKSSDKEDEKYYIVGESKTGLKPYRLAYLPPAFMQGIKLKLTYKEILASQNRIASGVSGYFRVGIGRASETLSTFLGVKTAIPEPKDNVHRVLQSSFFPSWSTPDERHVDEIVSQLKSYSEDVRMPIARLVSGIQTAFEQKTLTPLQELEYTALTLKTNIYRFLIDSNSMTCTFFTEMTVPKSRAIVVLQRDQDIDILAYVTRIGRSFSFKTNIYESPFTEEQQKELFMMSQYACSTKIPRAQYAILASGVLIPEFGDDIEIILDPYGRSQALFFPGKMILPFLSSAMLDVVYPKISGYSAIQDRLPTKESVMKALDILKPKYEALYAYESDIYDENGDMVEIMLKNGLRIPVVRIAGNVHNENRAEMKNVLSTPESVLTFGKRNEEHSAKYRDISYASEIFNYLIFELTKDIERDRNDIAIAIKTEDEQKVESILQEWFDSAIESTDVPAEFISKIRVPCGQFTQKNACETATMCGWNGSTCRIKVRKDISKPALFRKLLNGVMENGKIRAMVLEGRTTPFFSTILYMELPHEVILTDTELKSE